MSIVKPLVSPLIKFGLNQPFSSDVATLIDSGRLHPAFTFSRASNAALLDSNGNLIEFSSGTPRFDTQRGLIIEGARTNSVRNPRGEGFVAGTPGTPPTNWVSPTPISSLAREVLSPVVINGVSFTRIRYSGTASASNNIQIQLENASTAVSATEVWTVSALVGIIINSGSTPNVSLYNRQLDSGSALIDADTSSPVLSLTSTPVRHSRTATILTSAVTGIPHCRVSFSNTLSYDFILLLGAPQFERGAFASSPNLPTANSPAVTARASELTSTTLSNLGVNPSRGFTVIGRARIPQAAPSGADQMLWQVDNNSDATRYAFLNVSGGSTVRTRIGSTTGGALFTMTPNTEFTYAASIDVQAGTISVSVNGGAAVTQSSGPTSGLTHLRFGSNAAGASNAFSFFRQHRLIASPIAVSDLPNRSLTV